MQLCAAKLRRLVYHNAILVEFSPIVTIPNNSESRTIKVEGIIV